MKIKVGKSLMKQAHVAYMKKDYPNAYILYIKLGNLIGDKNVLTNIMFCEKKIFGEFLSKEKEESYGSLKINKVVVDIDLFEKYVYCTVDMVKPKITNALLFNFYRDAECRLAIYAAWLLWRKNKKSYLMSYIRVNLNKLGRMRELRTFLKEAVDGGVSDLSVSYRKIKDELNKFSNGFLLPSCSVSCYQSKKSVLYLLHNSLPYNSGGYATRTHGLLRSVVSNSDYKVFGVTRPGYPTDHRKYISGVLPKNIPLSNNIDGIEYFRTNQSIKKSWLTITEYVNYFADEIQKYSEKHKIRVIHGASNFPNGLAASLAARRLGIKSVYEVRGLWEITRMSRQSGWNQTEQFQYMAKMEAEACHAADAVITITSALKELMVSRGVDADKITVLPNCVHTDLFSPLERDSQLAEKLGIDEQDVVIGYIGSIVNYEGLDDLLSALAMLRDYGVCNFRFLMVGDGAVLDKLKEQVTKLGLQNYIVFTGRIPHEEVQKYYSLVDIAPFPRKPYLVCEAVSPLKPFEAMASRKAVLVSSCAALTEIVQDGYNGLVFEKGNIQSLYEKLRVLIENTEIRRNLAINGREWVIKERDWAHSAKKLIQVYNQLSVF